MAEPTSKSESTTEPKREPREPRALSNEYHKARKQLMLWAGILFIWELVGVDLEKAKEAGGNFGAVVGAIKSLQAVPWVLLILVGYFLFKCTVEWYQCNSARRAQRMARVDFFSAWVVCGLAYALYAVQAISHSQLADYLGQRVKGASYTIGAAGTLLALGASLLTLRYQAKRKKLVFILTFLLGAPLLILVGIGCMRLLFHLGPDRHLLIFGVGMGLFVISIMTGSVFLAMFMERLVKRGLHGNSGK